MPRGTERAGMLLAAALALPATGTATPSAPEARLGETVLVGRAGIREPSIAAFLGIPFAAPPVGDLRWRAPQRFALPHGRFDAARFAPACFQDGYNTDWYRKVGAAFGADPSIFSDPPFSEDCLYLNVWTREPRDGPRRPVMVWIHGGANRSGWSFEPDYDGERLAARGVVVVSIAYRVGVFGFFGHPDLGGATNFGLQDQVAALRWIRDNVEAFGGDPGNVTLFGESAGAADIGYLMASPAAGGLFRRAISQSGGYQLLERRSQAGVEAWGRALASAPGGKPGLAGLRATDSATIWAAAKTALAGIDYGPALDGEIVTAAPGETFLSRPVPVELLVGTNRDEWYMYVDGDPAALAAAIDGYPAATRPALRALADAAPTVQRGHDRAVTFANMVCPAYLMARAVQRGGAHAYVYRFTRVRPGAGGERLGAYHGAEIPYVFGTHDDWLATDAIDRRLTDDVMQYWVNFARSGDPNGPGLPAWPAYDAGDPRILALGDRVEPQPAPDHATCLEVANALYGARP